METTKLSSKGQIVIPKEIRDFYNWQPGLEFAIIDTGNEIILRPKRPFPETTLQDVAGSMPYDGPPITLEEMEQAIKQGIEEEYGRR